MRTVHEHIDAFPFAERPLVLERREELLLAPPLPAAAKRFRDHPPVEAVHFPPQYVEQPPGSPRGVYESEFLRVEWQTMNNRQPFYHRNCGADELSYQVCGERTLMTELGSVDLVPGEFSRLPNGVAHDNYGRRDIHLLFYVPDAVEQLLPSLRTAEPMDTPFPGWQAESVNELITRGLGGPGQDIVMAQADERLLLDHARHDPARIQVLRPGDGVPGTTWLYRSAHLLIGRSFEAASQGLEYRRHRNADEIQYQLSGQRTLVTQRGLLQLEPGDFVRIPMGIAFTSIHAGPSAHLTLVSTREAPQVAKGTKVGTAATVDELERLRTSH